MRGKQAGPAPTGIEEVVALENAVRELVPKLKGEHADLRHDARRIMLGRLGSGTRLGHLKRIVAELQSAAE